MNRHRQKRDFSQENTSRDKSEPFENYNNHYPGANSPEYKQYEKSFISVLEWIMFRRSPHDSQPIPHHSSFILRKLIKTFIFLVIIFAIGSGVEIYHEMGLDKPDDARPEYIEAVKQKSGTLDDL